MTFRSALALFVAMAILAAVPSISVLTVATRSATLGLLHGAFTTIGIVTGDLIFIVLAVWGLSQLAEAMGSLFVLIRYLSGIYLIGLGIGLYRSGSRAIVRGEPTQSSWLHSFSVGLAITLGDQKAILFYLGFFPAFVDLSKISYGDISLILVITMLAVGGVKLGYVCLADKARSIMTHQASRIMHLIASCVMVTVGLVLVIKAL